jgi:hypothetical protein
MKKLLVLAILLTAAPALADMTGNLTFRYADQGIPELAMTKLEVLLDGNPACEFDTAGYQPGDSFSSQCQPAGDIPPGPHEFSFRATLADGSFTHGDMVAMGTIPEPNPPVIIPPANPLEIIDFTVTVQYPDQQEQVIQTTLQSP